MQKIKNSICWIVILAVFIRPTPAQANPVIAAVAVGALISGTMVAGAGVYSQSAYDAASWAADSVTGDINRAAIVAKMIKFNATQNYYGYTDTIRLGFFKLADYVRAHAYDYPNLTNALNQGGTSDPGVGWVYTYNGINYKVITIVPFTTFSDYSCTLDNVPIKYNIDLGGGIRTYPTVLTTRLYRNFRVHPYATGAIYLDTAIITVQTTTDDVILPALSPPGFAAKINTDYKVPATQAEVDRIIKEQPAIVDRSPATSLTPAQIEDIYKQAERDLIRNRLSEVETQIAADPTNPTLITEAEALRKELEKADLGAQEAATKSEIASPPPAGPALDADLALDFSPFLGLKDKAMSKFPFSMVSSLGSLFSGLTSAPVTPSMDVPMPWGLASKQITLSHWDDFAGKWRMMIALFFHASCIYAIIRRYS